MRGATHTAAGMAIGVTYAAYASASLPETVAIIGCSAVASLIPDLDVCTSKLGRRVAPASFLIQLIFGHRSVFHAPLFYAAVLLPLYFTFPQYSTYLIAAALAITSHLLLDMFNPKGIPLLWPIKKRFRLANIPSGGIVDRMVGIVLYLTTIALVIRLASQWLQPLASFLQSIIH